MYKVYNWFSYYLSYNKQKVIINDSLCTLNITKLVSHCCLLYLCRDVKSEEFVFTDDLNLFKQLKNNIQQIVTTTNNELIHK